jgi:hypothetical protein
MITFASHPIPSRPRLLFWAKKEEIKMERDTNDITLKKLICNNKLRGTWTFDLTRLPIIHHSPPYFFTTKMMTLNTRARKNRGRGEKEKKKKKKKITL